ncbi:MAG: hypothetical protein IJZ75_00270 [Clostridia bacterium]|nr:hypothetical protein [Clostridia bacterium]
MENAEAKLNEIPESVDGNNASADEVTMPDTADKDIKIPIKFNKEERELSLSEAGSLAQKGLKYDMISPDFTKLKALAEKDGRSVSEFLTYVEEKLNELKRNEILSKCGGNEEIADRLIAMENKLSGDGGQMEELREFFPEIEDAASLPQEVLDKAKEKGSRLLDEYLRHLYSLKLLEKEKQETKKDVNKHTLGSLKTQDSGESDPVRNMFLKGIWG